MKPGRVVLSLIDHPASLVILVAVAGGAYWWISRRTRTQGPFTIDNASGRIVQTDIYDVPPVPGAIVAGSPGSTPGVPQSMYNAAREAARNIDWAFEPDYTYTDQLGPWDRFMDYLKKNDPTRIYM